MTIDEYNATQEKDFEDAKNNPRRFTKEQKVDEHLNQNTKDIKKLYSPASEW